MKSIQSQLSTELKTIPLGVIFEGEDDESHSDLKTYSFSF